MKRLLTILLLLTSCIDEIDFDPGLVNADLVIYGQFSAFEKDHFVTVFRTRGFGNEGTPIEEATVRIVDETGAGATLGRFEAGTYVLPAGTFKGVPGRSYTLEVSLPNGKKYATTPQVLFEAIQPEEVYFEQFYREEVTPDGVVISRPNIRLLLNSPTLDAAGRGVHIRWSVIEEFSFTDLSCHPLDPRVTCYFRLEADNTNFQLFSSVSSSQNEVKGIQVFERDLTPEFQFNERHVFSVHQYVMSEETFDYWRQVKIVASQSGSIFDQQPAAVPGNIYNVNNPGERVLGYFEVVGESVGRTFTTPTFLEPVQIRQACIDFIPYYQNRNEFCCSCFAIDEKLIPPPDYFLDNE